MIFNIMETSWEIFHKLFPEASFDDWVSSSNVPYEMIQEEAQKYGTEITKFRHVWVGENFFKWSRNVVSIHSEPVIALTEQYMDRFTDEEVTELYDEYVGSRRYSIFLLPIAMYSIGSNIPKEIQLTNAAKKEITAMLTRHFRTKKENVMIHDKLMRMDDYFEGFAEHFEEKVIKRFIDSEQIVSEPVFINRKQNISNAAIRCLPIGIRRDGKAIITWEEILKEEYPEEKMISERNFKPVFEELRKMFNYRFYFDTYRFLLEEEECEDFARDFYSFANKQNIINRLKQREAKMLRKNKNFVI